ncbi:MAG: hypothetical protein SF123_21855 [Chloroflexota bacterium]|nr:hypothetical protein [Chloroflexota bacterium]
MSKQSRLRKERRCQNQTQRVELPEEVRVWRETMRGFKRQGAALLDQQFWCWGCDIRHEENLFLSYGFIQTRASKDCGGTHYTICPACGGVLRLWGGTAVYVDEQLGALMIKRYDFEPRLLPSLIVPDLLPEKGVLPTTSTDFARCSALVAAVWGWIADYERWVLDAFGLPHRTRSVNAWKPNATLLIAPEAMAASWDALADQISVAVSA